VIRRDIDVQVDHFLEQSAERFPDKTALICGERRLTYRELNHQANRMAHALRAQGLERGDRVAIYLDNSVESVVAVFATLKAGGVFMLVNPTVKPDKLVYLLNDSRAAALFAPGRKVEYLRDWWPQTPHLRTIVAVGEAPAASATCTLCNWGTLLEQYADRSTPPGSRCIDIDLAALIYTSGSTGHPKGVMLTHLNIVSAATSITTYLENTADDIILNVLPISFDYGLYQVLMAFKLGATLVLERSFTYPHKTLELLARERVTGLPLVPTISAILLQMDFAKYDFSSLRYVTNTAAALPTEHIQQLRRLLPHARIYSMYGLTECKRVSYLPPDQIDIRPTSVGRGMPNEEVYIVDDEGRRVGSGVVGELVIRGANVMKGYWELPEETAKRLKPGPLPGEFVLYSGDLFRSDEEGYLYFVGRRDDIIKSRGEKVSPKEVENVLFSHPAVLEAAVVGVPDAVLGEKIKAIVTLKAGMHASDRELLRFCAGRLEDFMVPQIIEVRDALPKTLTGKIDKGRIKAEV
jgi:amino acid adenylation domain-containing protein